MADSSRENKGKSVEDARTKTWGFGEPHSDEVEELETIQVIGNVYHCQDLADCTAVVEEKNGNVYSCQDLRTLSMRSYEISHMKLFRRNFSIEEIHELATCDTEELVVDHIVDWLWTADKSGNTSTCKKPLESDFDFKLNGLEMGQMKTPGSRTNKHANSKRLMFIWKRSRRS